MLQIIKFIVFVAVTLAIILFALANRNAVTVNFYPLEILYEVPLFVLVMSTFLIGIILGGITSWKQWLGRYFTAREKNKKIQALEQEVAALKAQKNITYSLEKLKEKNES